MTRRVISLIRDAGSETAAQHAHRRLSDCSKDAQLRPGSGQRGERGLLNATSQLAWQNDSNTGASLPLVEHSGRHDDDLDGAIRSDQGHVSRSWQFLQRSNQVLPLDGDVTDDVDRRERRRHRRERRKRRRHRHEQQQQTVVNRSCSPTSGQQSTDSVTSALTVL